MPLRFEADYLDLKLNFDPLINEVFGELKSGFLELPKGQGFIEYSVFEDGYQALKKATSGFTTIEPAVITAAVYAKPIALIVLRTILGFTPSEWADVTIERAGVAVGQGSARTVDRRIRAAPLTMLKDKGSLTDQRLKAMIVAAVEMLKEDLPAHQLVTLLHRHHALDRLREIRRQILQRLVLQFIADGADDRARHAPHDVRLVAQLFDFLDDRRFIPLRDLWLEDNNHIKLSGWPGSPRRNRRRRPAAGLGFPGTSAAAHTSSPG